MQRFVDKEAEFLFVKPDQLAEVQQSQHAIGFDAPGAKYAHDKGMSSFEQIIRDYDLTKLGKKHSLSMIVMLAQSPLPCGHGKVPNLSSEFRHVELNRQTAI